MTYEKRKELEKFSMGVVGSRNSYKKEKPEEDAQVLTEQEIEDLIDFLDNKIDDYIKNTFEPKIKEIFKIIELFKPISKRDTGIIYVPEYVAVNLYNGQEMIISKRGTQYKSYKKMYLLDGFDVDGNFLAITWILL